MICVECGGKTLNPRDLEDFDNYFSDVKDKIVVWKIT